MHYTSTDNIHKVIDPLFMNSLYDDFRAICRRQKKNRIAEFKSFHNKIAQLKFFDPACGSGNFLTETYLSLRRLENAVFQAMIAIDETAPCAIEVSIDRFFGIEINDYAVAVAQTAMWISEDQMLFETNYILHQHKSSLPLKRSARIVCGNALELDWHSIAPNVDYVIGNPPFSGARVMTPDKKAELLRVFDGWKNVGNLDYVCCWFKRAADFMIGTKIRAAFVSTNSICQGESVGTLWAKLLQTVHIDFAYRTFKWTQENESEKKERLSKSLPAPKETAAVHCVAIGFGCDRIKRRKIIFDGNREIEATNINGYLLDAPNFFVESRSKPLCNVPSMTMGSMPVDGGNLIIEADQYDEFIRREPGAKKFIRQYIGAEEFINGKARYCLWLVDVPFEEFMSLPRVAVRIEAVRQFRRSSKREATRKRADTPQLFSEIRQPKSNYILVPRITSENRKYIPMGIMSYKVIARDGAQIIPNAELFHFGVLESSVHMAWMRVVCGRLEMRYNYSGTIVYNNFPWCARTSAIEKTARGILDARAKFGDWSLAALYDEKKMPSELRAAHSANDLAVLDAYGFARDMSEAEIITRLMVMYQKLVDKKNS